MSLPIGNEGRDMGLPSGVGGSDNAGWVRKHGRPTRMVPVPMRRCYRCSSRAWCNRTDQFIRA
jgi:hypothetical protein